MIYFNHNRHSHNTHQNGHQSGHIYFADDFPVKEVNAGVFLLSAWISVAGQFFSRCKSRRCKTRQQKKWEMKQLLLMEEILHHFQRPTVETSRSQFNIVWRHSDQNGFVRVTEILHHLSACHSTLSLGVRGCKLCIGKCMVVEVVQDFFHPPKKEKDSLYFWSRTIFPATSYFHRIKPIIGSNRFFSQ